MKRLFASENTRQTPNPDDYRQAFAMSQTLAAPASSPAPGGAAFPYPVVQSINFANAQAAEIWVPANGYALSFWDSTNITDVVNVRFARSQGDLSGQPIPFRPGHALGLGDFSWIGLTWAQIVGASGTLLILPRGILLDDNR